MQESIAQKAQALLKKHPNWGRRNIAKVLGVRANGELRSIVEKLKANLPINRKVDITEVTPEESREYAGNSATLATRKYGICTLQQLLDYMKVDLKVWEVERYVINKWEVGGKPAENNALKANTQSGFAVEPLFQVKAWLKKRVAVVRAKSVFDEMLAAFRAKSPRQKLFRPATHNGLLFECDIFDPHFGKLCWAEETGNNYDIKIAERMYGEALEGLIHRIGGQKVERILYPIGNDFFHVDNAHNTTPGGTAQDCDGRWQKAFIQGRKAVKESIERLRRIAPVDVVMVAGNHDPERVFYLGEVLSGWFYNTAGVMIDNSPTKRKYYRYGQNLIGFTHGNNEKHKDLPLVMATEAAQDWALTKFREFHVGHFHHLRTTSFLPTEEFRSIRVRVLSSLTPPDAWHKAMGYEGLRAANGFLWDKADGCVSTISYNA